MLPGVVLFSDTLSRCGQYFGCVIIQDLELALGRFESGGLSGILELEGAIETTKMTHLLIQESGLGVRSEELYFT